MAAVLPATLTVDGPTRNDPQIANDGIFPAVGTEWNLSNSVQFGPNLLGRNTNLTYSFAELSSVTGINMIADGNDYYTFSFFNGGTLSRYFEFSPYNGGLLQSFRTDLAPTLATRVVVTGRAGDQLYSIGEVQFSGTVAAVPGPATWAMMMVGFAMLGASARYRRRATRAVFA
ncbi:hypothetical protein GGQ96_002187 [Sphingomonas abaci]|uniref:PEP-CTERM protein-sorting domain-containing protein n=1 Tax=Sphingomonas abaci TaxID=237611 RepID=A0A7W7AJ82_9SPHN|nr:PEPxxWA-CTERM sorting domain-containing protein [Sphingomonas abaci]MBB4618051.1 hypothetical protein [Sphingomonas abaci]